MRVNWDKVRLYTFISVIVSSPISFLTFSDYSKGGQPSSFSVYLSVLLVVFWFIYGVKVGLKKGNDFIIFLILFWGGGVFSFVLGYNFDLVRDIDYIILAFPTLFIYGPLYGLRYFFNYPLGITLALYSTIIALIVSLLGFLIGKILKYQNNKQ